MSENNMFLNDFQLKSVIVKLNQFNIVKILPIENEINSSYYFIFYKYKDLILIELILFKSSLNPDNISNNYLSKFINDLERRLEFAILDVENFLFNKSFFEKKSPDFQINKIYNTAYIQLRNCNDLLGKFSLSEFNESFHTRERIEELFNDNINNKDIFCTILEEAGFKQEDTLDYALMTPSKVIKINFDKRL